jgi:hypothetical protein
MSTTIGRLAVAVLGNIDDFKKNFGEAKKGVVGFQQTVQKTDVDLKKVGRSLTLAGSAIVGSLTAVTIATAQTADNIDFLAKQTGVTREELQQLAYAAQQENASLEGLSTSLIRLSKNMYDAARGTGDAKDVFKDLGVAIKDSSGNLRNADDVLMDVAERFKDLPNDTERSAAAMKIFGRSGAELIPLLRNGKDGIEALKKEARDLGHVISEESVLVMEKLADELVAAKTGFAGIGRQIAADVAPGLLNLATGAKEFFKWIHLIPDDLRRFIVQGTMMVGTTALISGGLATVAAKIGALKLALASLNASFAPFLVGSAIFVGLTALVALFVDLKKNIDLARTSANDFTDSMKIDKAIELAEKQIKALQNQKKVWEDSLRLGMPTSTPFTESEQKQLDELLKRREELLKRKKELDKEETRSNEEAKTRNETRVDLETQWTKKYLEATNQRLAALRLERDEAIKNAEELGASTKTLQQIRDIYGIKETELIDSIIKQSPVFQNQAAAIDMVSDAQQRLNQMLGVASPEWELYAKTLEEMAAKEGVLDATAERLQILADAIRNAGAGEEIRALKEELHSSVSDAIKTGFEEGKASSAIDSLADYIKNKFYSSIAEAITDAFFKTQMGQWFSNTFTSAFNTESAGTYGGARAAGGSVTQGVIYKVNENPYAPEYFQSNESGKIIPLSQMGNQAPNVDVNIINQAAPVKVKEQPTQFNGKKWVKTIILEGVANDPEFAAALGVR